jgi:Lrp/AsnC family leucine-responsive transcriptional regulator
MIDIIDKQILNILQSDARIPNSEIAKQIGIVASATAERIRKLQQKGLIKGYEVRLEPKSLDYGLVAFISVVSEEPVKECQTALRLCAIPEVQEVHNIAGQDCYLIKVRVKDPEALGVFLREKIGAIEFVKSTRTTIVLETFKETLCLPIEMNGKENGRD